VFKAALRCFERLFGIARPQTPVLFSPDTSLLALPDFVPPNFVHGLEVLNDNRTPMQFVVTMLRTHAGLSYNDAIRTMLRIHNRGGALLATASLVEAQRIAAAISEASAHERHPLVCRAVSGAPQ
jgi:ATP-dependent Clp protease adapter protein ClpS